MSNKMNLSFANVTSIVEEIPDFEELVINGKEYVSQGKNNNFYNQLYFYYNNCTILQSIINSINDYSVSEFEDKNMEDLIVNDDDQMTLLELYKLIAIDYVIYGSYALNVRLNQNNEVVALNYLNPKDIRISTDKKYAFYHTKWGKNVRKVNKYPLYKKGTTEKNTIFYHKNPKSRGVYGLPIWGSAIKDVAILLEVTNFHLNSIKNNFCPSAILSFNAGIPSPEDQQMLEDKINEKFSSSKNASRLLIVWSQNQETKPTLERLSSDDFDQRYLSLSESVIDNVLSAFRCSPQLVGLTNKVSSGFNSVEFQDAFSLWKNVLIKPLQKELMNSFKKIEYKFQPQLKEVIINFGDNQIK